MLDLKIYLGLLPTVLGVLILSSGLYFMFFSPSREKFWGCMIIGSILMGSGLVCGAHFTEDIMGGFIGMYLISATVWMIHMVVFSIGTSFLDGYYNKKEILSRLGVSRLKLVNGDIADVVSGGLPVEGYYACWDSYYSKGDSFKYQLLKVVKVDTWLNGFKKDQHFKYFTVERNLASIEECNEYLGKYNNTPVRL